MRWIWASVGFTSLIIGAIGILLPIWPTTVFWIIAAFCLAESHPTARDWIYNRPAIGPVIRTFIEQGQIDRRGKIGAIGGIFVAGAISGFALRHRILVLGIVLTILLAVCLFVATRPEPKSRGIKCE